MNNVTGIIAADTAIVDFTGFYDVKAKGKAKLYLRDGLLVWETISTKGDIYVPKNAIMNIDTVLNSQ